MDTGSRWENDQNSRTKRLRSDAIGTEKTLALEFERDVEFGAIGFNLALGIQLQIKLDDFGDAKISERFSRPVDRCLGGLLPRFLAGTDQFNDLVNTLSHIVLPSMLGRKQVIL